MNTNKPDYFDHLDYRLVHRLPRKKNSATIYLKETKEGTYKEYIWLGGKWHMLQEYNVRNGIIEYNNLQTNGIDTYFYNESVDEWWQI